MPLGGFIKILVILWQLVTKFFNHHLLRQCCSPLCGLWCKMDKLSNRDTMSAGRRDDGREIDKGAHQLDNRWVVPYNPGDPYLAQKYNAHNNVEICATVKSVSPSTRYVCKGHNSAQVQITAGVSLPPSVASGMHNTVLTCP